MDVDVDAERALAFGLPETLRRATSVGGRRDVPGDCKRPGREAGVSGWYSRAGGLCLTRLSAVGLRLNIFDRIGTRGWRGGCWSWLEVLR